MYSFIYIYDKLIVCVICIHSYVCLIDDVYGFLASGHLEIVHVIIHNNMYIFTCMYDKLIIYEICIYLYVCMIN
jgi:hypothetical protein